jgi:hypothetical protein
MQPLIISPKRKSLHFSLESLPPRIYYVVVMYLVALAFAILGVSVLLGAPLQEW